MDEKARYTTCSDEMVAIVPSKGGKDKNEIYGEASSPPPVTRFV